MDASELAEVGFTLAGVPAAIYSKGRSGSNKCRWVIYAYQGSLGHA